MEVNGELPNRYSLYEPDSLIVFAAATVLSGIIGNFSFEIVKKVVQLLLAKPSEHRPTRIGIERYLESDADIDHFYAQINEFYTRKFEKMDSRVWAAIEEEMHCAAVSSSSAMNMVRASMKNTAESPTEFQKRFAAFLLDEIRDREFRKQLLDAAFFSRCWSKLNANRPDNLYDRDTKIITTGFNAAMESTTSTDAPSPNQPSRSNR